MVRFSSPHEVRSDWGDWQFSDTQVLVFPLSEPRPGTAVRWLTGQGEGGSHSWVYKNFKISKNMLLGLLWGSCLHGA